MAEPKPATPDPAPAAPASGRRGLLRKLLPVAVVLAVVAAECVIAYSYLPSPSPTEAMAHAVVHGPPPPPKPTVEAKHEAKHGEEKREGEPDLIEVDLGLFTVTSVQAGSNNTLRIAFRLYGTVAKLDQERCNARMKETQHRFREAVILAIRGAEMSDLTEPGLGLLKRTILEKTNSTLGEPLLKAIVVSEFSFMEV